MHMPKSLLPVSALTLSLLAGSAMAKDTETEAQLREALRQKLSEITNQPVATVAAPAPAPAPAPAVTAPAAPTAPPPAVRPVAVPATEPVARVAAAPTAAPAPAWADDPETAKLREALRQRLDQEVVNPTPPAPVVAVAPEPAAAPIKPTPEQPAPAKPAPAASTAGTKPSAYPPLTPPELPISASKQERLQELLKQYKADQITPAEYHAQRAKIIAE
jgi:hypothetical protein